MNYYRVELILRHQRSHRPRCRAPQAAFVGRSQTNVFFETAYPNRRNTSSSESIDRAGCPAIFQTVWSSSSFSVHCSPSCGKEALNTDRLFHFVRFKFAATPRGVVIPSVLGPDLSGAIFTKNAAVLYVMVTFGRLKRYGNLDLSIGRLSFGASFEIGCRNLYHSSGNSCRALKSRYRETFSTLANVTSNAPRAAERSKSPPSRAV